jgi:ComF family protein
MEGLTCMWAYEGVARKLITQAKYNYYYDYLSELLVVGCRLLTEPQFAYMNKFLQGNPVVVPVPLWPKREQERGFNQAKIICQSLGKISGLETGDCLVRIKDTGRQVGRKREERLEAMRGAFCLNPKFKSLNPKQILNSNYQIPKQVLLVDDVWTTGATMNECAKVLKQAGVKRVWGLVLAR